MQVGVQFRGTLAAGETQKWLTVEWPEGWHVVWSLVPTSPGSAAVPQLASETEVERTADNRLNYWFTVHNLGSSPMDFEARYAVVHP
jgi:hypothetical protein